ncbi:glycine cleavage system aminomethyltransferase GcvT [Ferviditalea candida]|uniref:Aminomethyltransferase n=1 Tax=Ferviditalea candida TaxID=3108399 RepID=A0ABU5ZCH2_9BACL|nr:glycine cleavage system aminomethyltransferase GcvT [Paenibacillaceae bacterium T2]
MNAMKRTPLYPVYVKHGAKTIDFGGWELPVQFAGIQKEHEAVRTKAGLFDVSHMGEIRVTGSDSFAFLQHLLSNDLSKLQPYQAQYTLMCYPDGGVVDDLLVYKYADDHYMLVVNASNTSKDFDWLQKHAEGDVRLEDISERTALIALQGPAALTIMKKLTEAPLEELRPFRFVPEAQAGGHTVMISRTGYTGEDGFEIYLPAEDAPELWEKLLEKGGEDGLLPAGLGARDTLRFEAALPLYGQELSSGISPLEAGLGMFVKLDKGDFIGREALAEQKRHGTRRRLVGIEMIERGIPRSHYPVFAGDRQIGEVTTGTQSPTFKTNIGLALIDTAYASAGTEVAVEIRGKKLKAKVVATPFYRREKR